MTLRVGSVFTGGGFLDKALEEAGMEIAWQCEIDPQCNELLERHWLGKTRYRDVARLRGLNGPLFSRRGEEDWWDWPEPVDVLAGGFPCQGLSVAGRREGLRDARSGLWYEFHRLITELQPGWVLIENVPGLLSSGARDPDTGRSRKGLDFAIILAGLTGLVPQVPEGGWRNAGAMRGRPGCYHVAWRVLDAQYFGVAQRHRRVWLVGYLGNRSPLEVLFEREGLLRSAPPRRRAGQRTASPVKASAPGRRNGGSEPTPDEFVVADTLIAGAHPGSDNGEDDHNVVSGTLGAAHGRNRGAGQENETALLVVFGGNNRNEIDVATSISAHPTGRYDFASDTFVVEALDVRHLRSGGEVSAPLQAKENGGHSLNFQNPVVIRTTNTGGNGDGVNEDGTVHTLGGSRDAVAFDWQNGGRSGRERIVRSGNYAQVRPRAVDAIAFTERRRADGRAVEIQEELAYSLTDMSAGGSPRSGRIAYGLSNQPTPKIGIDIAPSLDAKGEGGGRMESVAGQFGVRRLMPVECERLQGVQDGWTAGLSDSARYRIVGNAVCLTNVAWIGMRMVAIHEGRDPDMSAWLAWLARWIGRDVG